MLLASFPIRTSSRQDVARDFVPKNFEMAAVNRRGDVRRIYRIERIRETRLKGTKKESAGIKRKLTEIRHRCTRSISKAIGSSNKVRVLFWGQMATVHSANIRDRSVKF
ncbi:hypothetical protein KQX54_000537 [Cotesia glomerata]|uniref:Uncharacterized protein n=1 Tax=Cotesia glomerata TaxID=32391 RepID=A0AAV7I5L9_COTGL|nr:hypothetical protein KQX54_000537 [Cotesia glomerata]